MTARWPLSKLVQVEWRDSAAHSGWQSVEDCRSSRGVGPIRSTGYVVAHDKSVIQLAQSMSAMTGDISNTVTIPCENIVRIKKLR